MAKLTRDLRAQIANLELEVKHGLKREQELRERLHVEQLLRVSAQNGLVPYVRGLEEFNRRFKEYRLIWRNMPERLHALEFFEGDLKELGLWQIKLGYDPNKDLALSVISAKRGSA